MIFLAKLIALSIFVLGFVGVLSPEQLIALTGPFLTPSGLKIASGIRIVIGLVLILVASHSRAPMTMRVMGAIILVAGVVAGLAGPERTSALVHWARAEQLWGVRLAGLLITAAGALIGVAAGPASRRSAANTNR